MTLDPAIVHHLLGVFLALVALLLLLHLSGMRSVPGIQWLPGSTLIALGFLLMADPWLSQGSTVDIEGLLSVLAMLAGVAELVRVNRSPGPLILRLIFPAFLAAAGLGLLSHAGQPAGDLLLAQHRVMGATLLLASVVKFAEVWRIGREGWAGVAWVIAVLVVAIELLLYVGGHSGSRPL